jgi:hypothetical protein
LFEAPKILPSNSAKLIDEKPFEWLYFLDGRSSFVLTFAFVRIGASQGEQFHLGYRLLLPHVGIPPGRVIASNIVEGFGKYMISSKI